ncbi:MAG: TadE family protein [Pseudomonadota bacterium]
MVRRRRPESGERGQATVEFALMIPLLFALLFMCIEFAFYFGAIHYDNYAAFVTARGVQVGEDSASAVESMLLNGNVSKNASISTDDSSATVQQLWRVDTPGLHQVLGDIDFSVTAVLGPEEFRYEGQVNPQFADNNGGGLGQ